MKKTWTIAVIVIVLIVTSVFGLTKHIGDNYIYGKSAVMDTIVNFLRFSHVIQWGMLKDEELEELKKIPDEIEKIDFIEMADFFQQAYMKEVYKEVIRRIPVKEEERAEVIPVLMYHHLLYEDENTYINNDSVISVENFIEQMKLLYDNGYHTITLAELEEFLLGNLDLPKKTVAITFDDGYLSNVEYAYEILKEYNFKASNFLITHKLKEVSKEFNPYELQYLSWKDMLNTLDVFTYDNHTHDLHRLEGKNGYLVTKSLEEVIEDLSINKKLTQSPYFAYPYGQYSTHTLQILELLDVRMAFTVEKGYVKPGDNLLRLKRQGILPNTTLKDFKKIIDLH